MKSSFCIDLQRFMLIPTKFPLSPYQGLHQQISIYIRRKTDNSLVNQTIIAKFAPILQGVEVHI